MYVRRTYLCVLVRTRVGKIPEFGVICLHVTCVPLIAATAISFASSAHLAALNGDLHSVDNGVLLNLSSCANSLSNSTRHLT